MNWPPFFFFNFSQPQRTIPKPFTMTSTSVTLPFNLTVGEESATWMYTPIRDGDVMQGWNSSYTGSTVWSGGEGIGQAFRRTQKDEAGFWMEWEGTALYLCLSTLDNAGYSFTVDGQAMNKVGLGSDPACSAFAHDPNHGPQMLLVADGLKYGHPHLYMQLQPRYHCVLHIQ
ncbi:hypothetical protein CALCODRAFT_135305 [Calocera cornea HHB12733]|uniref:Uncharacterized protein n=1 Tax=Calocera cornea HHB12733 TaxID=1353952 RepID=A0A165CV81_9BASI|nr:hypothetical protein CALCODRAFT_135305 [Calocera cornea HHB12733]